MALARQSREYVFQLRQFHLQTPFGRAGATGEYIEDQLGAVDDLDVNGGFEVALLRGSEFVVDNQDVGLMCLGEFFQFLYFAVSKQSGRVEDGTDLEHLGRNSCAGACGQFGKLAKRFGGGRRR